MIKYLYYLNLIIAQFIQLLLYKGSSERCSETYRQVHEQRGAEERRRGHQGQPDQRTSQGRQPNKRTNGIQQTRS